jgi:hypothetical protein
MGAKTGPWKLPWVDAIKVSVKGVLLTATGAQINKAGAFFGATDITGAEAEELTDGSTTAKHEHALAVGANDVTASAAEVNALDYDAGRQAVAVIDFNTGAAEAGCKVVIGGVEYQEADAEDLPNGVWTNGASEADSAASFLAAVNSDTRNGGSPFTALALGTHAVALIADAVGVAGNAVITTDSANNVTVENAHGGAAAAKKRIHAVNYVVTAQDVLAGIISIPTPFTPRAFIENAKTAAGLDKAHTGLVTIAADPARISIDNTAGATHLAATDVVHLIVWE